MVYISILNEPQDYSMPTTRQKTASLESPPPTRGFKKKARTRQALVDAAIRLYAEKGVGELLLNDLAEHAGVSNGTVYNYFKSREEVLLAVGIELANQLSHRVTALSEGTENGAERVAIGVRMFIQQGRQDPIWAAAVVRVFQYDKHIRSVVAANLRIDLRLGLQQGIFHFEDEIIAMGYVASVTTGAITGILDGFDRPHYDAVAAEMLLLGLGVTKAEANRIAQLPLPDAEPEQNTQTVKKIRRGRPPSK